MNGDMDGCGITNDVVAFLYPNLVNWGDSITEEDSIAWTNWVDQCLGG